MKEIKFRAWQKYHKRMLEVIGLKYENNELTEIAVKYPNGHIPNKIWYSKNNSDFYLYNDVGDCILELMQYTGIKDINDKEYCEGDIYKYENPNYGYGGKAKEFKYMIFENIEDLYFDDSFEWKMKHGEIIGNIFDSPELLELL